MSPTSKSPISQREVAVYSEHGDLDRPEDTAILWRYMDFTKFVSLLDRRALFFVRADKLGDPFEGAYTKLNMNPEVLDILMPGVDERSRRGLFQHLQRMRAATLISCWHEGVSESDAMWRVFVEGNNGVALRTTFASLSQSFRCEEDVLIGRVAYKDYDTDVISLQNALFPFFHKRKAFSHEYEVRALTTDLEVKREPVAMGTYYEVDLATLISEIRVSPDADDWFVELVRSVATTYSIDAPIGKSKLSDVPIWSSTTPR